MSEEEPRWSCITFPLPKPKDTDLLLQACLHGSASEVIRLLDEDLNRLNEKDAGKMTPLITAVVRGDVEIVRALLPFNVQVDETDAHSTSALRYSSCLGLVDIVELLLKVGANPRGRPEIGDWTPLHSAALGGHIDIARLLIEKGALLFDERYSEQPVFTAGALNHVAFVEWALSLMPSKFQLKRSFTRDLLVHSMTAGAIDVVKWLASQACAGIDYSVLRSHGCHPVQYAALSCSFEVLRWLVDDIGLSPLSLCSESNQFPIWHAIIGGSPRCFDFLQSRISIDFNPSTSRNLDGRTCLMTAAGAGSIELFKRFLACNPDIDATDSDNNTALILASGKGVIEMVKLCVDAGAKLDAVNKHGLSALSLALRRDHPEVANYLLTLPVYNADPMPDGSTILDFAVISGSVEAAKRIAALHPEMTLPPKRQNIFGLLSLALISGNMEMVNWIEADFGIDMTKDATLVETLIECAEASHVDSIRWLMKLQGVEDPHWRDTNGLFSSGPVLRAIEGPISNSNSECVLALIEGGFDLNSTEYATPPLHQACRAGELDLAKLLVEHGASLTYETDQGTILHCAAESDVRMLDWTIAQLKSLQSRSKFVFEVNLASRSTQTTPFMLSSDRDVAQRLLDEGADHTLLNSDSENASTFAAQLNKVDFLSLLADHDCDFTQLNSTGSLPIHIAAWNGSIEATEFLMLHTDTQIFSMDNIYFMAAYGDHLSFILHFINCGHALPSNFDRICAESGNSLLYQRLFEDGHLSISDEALSAACAQGHLKMAKFLFHNGASLRNLASNGDTLMTNAFYSRSLSMVQWLLKQGCPTETIWESTIDPGPAVATWLSKVIIKN